MKYTIIYKIGDAPDGSDREEFPAPDAAKTFAAQSLKMKLTMSAAATGSASVSVIKGPGIADTERLGAYSCGRAQEPVWTEDDE